MVDVRTRTDKLQTHVSRLPAVDECSVCESWTRCSIDEDLSMRRLVDDAQPTMGAMLSVFAQMRRLRNASAPKRPADSI